MNINKKKPFVITLAHEKGGTGKSTLSTHLAIGLMYYNSNYKVSLIDLDHRQLSSWNFFSNRLKHNLQIPNLHFCEKLTASLKDSKKEAFEDDFNNLNFKMNSMQDSDFIIIDIAGSHNNYMIASMSFTDLLITPVTESFFDIDAIVRLSKVEKNIMNGPFYEIVFEERKARKLKDLPQLKWSLVINRASALYHENSEKVHEILENISKNLDFSIDHIIKDRQIYKELCNHGLTIFDLPHLIQDMTMIRMKAHAEMDQWIFKVIETVIKQKENQIIRI